MNEFWSYGPAMYSEIENIENVVEDIRSIVKQLNLEIDILDELFNLINTMLAGTRRLRELHGYIESIAEDSIETLDRLRDEYRDLEIERDSMLSEIDALKDEIDRLEGLL